MSALRTETDEEIEAKIATALTNRNRQAISTATRSRGGTGAKRSAPSARRMEETLKIMRLTPGNCAAFFIASAARLMRQMKFSISTTSFRSLELLLSKTA